MGVVQELGSRDPNGVVTAGPWMQRDGYVADTAIAIERLTAKIERLERREDALQKQVAELVEFSQQAGRFQSLAESLRNSRDYKIDDVSRQMRDMRARLEAIEGPKTDFTDRTYRTFVDMSRQLTELSRVVDRKVRWGALGRQVAGGVVMVTSVGAFVAVAVGPLL